MRIEPLSGKPLTGLLFIFPSRAVRRLVLRARTRDRGSALLRQVPRLQPRPEGQRRRGHGRRHQDHRGDGE